MGVCVWRSWAPLKCKIFAWLAMQYRLWTSDRRARHGLQDEPQRAKAATGAKQRAHVAVAAAGRRGTMVVPVGVSGGEVKMGGGPGFDLGVLM